jgi:hypothetical protein
MSMSRRICRVGAVSAAALGVLTACSHTAGSARPALGLRVSPGKARYGPGEPVVLSLVLTNHAGTACRLSRIPAGAVSLRSLTRDGQPVLPTLARATYIAGFHDVLVAALTTAAPGKIVSMSVVSRPNPSAGGRAAVETSSLDSDDEESLLVWPVDRPGRYQLTASYLLPALGSGFTDLCRGQSNWDTTAFTVTGR